MTHPLLDPANVAAVEQAASAHRGRPWTCSGFTGLDDRAAHPCGILHGTPFSVFAKLSAAENASAHFSTELAGLELIARLAPVGTPAPVAGGLVETKAGWLLVQEARTERAGLARTSEDFAAIGRTMAALHQVRAERFGLAGFNGFFGPIAQDNRPVPSNRWADFYGQRRVEPMLRLAAGSGHLPADLSDGVRRVLHRLPDLCGREPAPCLLHGDSQQNNFLCTPDGVVVIDASPYFGHPEIDLALVDYFEPVPPVLFDGYREITPIDDGFAARRELWRIFGYLAVVAVAGQDQSGRRFITSLAAAVRRYR